jgi:hypothetical protein
VKPGAREPEKKIEACYDRIEGIPEIDWKKYGLAT